MALYKRRPGSKEKQPNPKVSVTALLDTMEGLWEKPGLNVMETPRVDRSSEHPTFVLPPSSFLPFEARDKLLDVPALMDKAHDLVRQQTGQRRPVPPAIVAIEGNRAHPCLKDCLSGSRGQQGSFQPERLPVAPSNG